MMCSLYDYTLCLNKLCRVGISFRFLFVSLTLNSDIGHRKKYSLIFKHPSETLLYEPPLIQKKHSDHDKLQCAINK